MTVKEFCVEYASLLNEEVNSEEFRVRYKKSSEYTNYIRELMRGRMKDWFREKIDANLKDYPEFFKIDFTWWKEKEKDDCNGVNIYDWNQVIVIEHENDKCDWTYEVAKLDFIRAELRIVIGFAPTGRTEADDLCVINAQCMKLKYLSDESEFGVILMNEELRDSNDLGIRGYLLRTNGKSERVF